MQQKAGRLQIFHYAALSQGLYAGLQVTRSAYIAGFTGTSNVLAGKKYGIPVSGTMGALLCPGSG